jgi:hypothetical protein
MQTGTSADVEAMIFVQPTDVQTPQADWFVL